MSAKDKKRLLVHLHKEYRINIKSAISEHNHDNLFKDIPYLNCWMNKTEDNEYIKLIANLDSKKVRLKVSKVEVDHIKVSIKGWNYPFRLSWSNYILTSCYLRYLRAMQKGLAPYLKFRKRVK
uniref:Uncharacterized protein n=1 Tax=Oryza punctata TaxID=4537 RepID=A0A0E0JE14_ORYPU